MANFGVSNGGDLDRLLGYINASRNLTRLADQNNTLALREWTNMGFPPAVLSSLLRNGQIPAGFQVPPPNSASCPCPNRYAPGQTIDLADANSPIGQLLTRNPFLRQQVEM